MTRGTDKHAGSPPAPWMRLERYLYRVDSVACDPETRLDGRVLRVNRGELEQVAAAEPAVARARVELVNPGERTRVVQVLDAVPAMVKTAGRSGVFPGLLGPAHTAGDGRSHWLVGTNVLMVGTFPVGESGVGSVKTGLVDMWGPGAPYSVYGASANVVIVYEQAPGATVAAYDHAMRLGTLRAARYLAEAVLKQGAPPAEIETQALEPVSSDLPRVAYIAQLHDQGLLRSTRLYGKPVDQLDPTIIHPNELTDGALVSASYFICFKVSTHLRCADPFVAELRRLHGKELDFVGVVLSRGHQDGQALKERSAEAAAKTARLLGADSVVLSLEGSGNAFIDYMLTIRACETIGLKAVAMVHELGGPDGRDEPMVDVVPEAVAMVSTGNARAALSLPAPECVIGVSDSFRDSFHGTRHAGSALTVGVDDMFCGVWSMGINRFTAVEF